ncbi:hypothetical protein C4587_00785 [Candidatus Parcubacteria bacterium]|nr:MAG: hypothetical protein C4587_00785 [Candidatus Parcubacteria bacterium]
MSIAAAARAMLDSGATAEQIVAMVERAEDIKREKTRASNAERQRRFRANNSRNDVTRDSVTVTDVTRDAVTDAEPYIARAGAPVCSNDFSNEKSKLDTPLPSEGHPQAKKPKAPTPLEILSEVVSEKTAADVIAHRKALRKPLTPRAAELLAKSLVASGDAERAAATMIERGWQGYRADWDVPNSRAGPTQQFPGTKKTEFMAFYEQLCEDTKGYGKQAESEVFDGNVHGIPVIRN